LFIGIDFTAPDLAAELGVENSAEAHCCNSDFSAIVCAILSEITSPPSVQYISAELASRRS
jgi:hypothetical protein